MAHPDHGGSAQRFAEIRAARDLLLQPEPVPSRRSRQARAGADRAPGAARDAGRGSAAAAPEVPLRPRKPWSKVLVTPAPSTVAILTVAAVLSVLAMLVGTSVEMPWGVVPAAVASALWCVALSRAVLRGADHGHVIVTRTAGWTVVTAGQLVVAVLAGIPVVEVLPVLALPFVMAIAAVNPAAGLRRAPRVNVR